MANIAQTVNVLQAMVLTEGERMVVTPSYHAFAMYKVHQNAELVPVDVHTDDYAFGDHTLPAVHASASRKSGSTHISLVNLDPESTVTTALENFPGHIRGEVLTCTTINAVNTFDEPDRVAPAPFAAFQREGPLLRVVLPPKAVVVLKSTPD
jgi:alpha-N-arabinofuranosidase